MSPWGQGVPSWALEIELLGVSVHVFFVSVCICVRICIRVCVLVCLCTYLRTCVYLRVCFVMSACNGQA